MTWLGRNMGPESTWRDLPRQLARLVWPAAAIAVAYVVWKRHSAILATLRAVFPRTVRRSLIVGVLDGLLVSYAFVVVLLVVGLAVLALMLVRSRNSLIRRPWLARLLLLDLSLMIGLAGLEVTAWGWMGWLHRDPPLPRFQPGPANGPLRILVIGESSAQGKPYEPWLSVGQIVGWKLEKVFPGRPTQVDMQAEGGATLERVHQKLAQLAYRPDALLLFCGHNEFQARWAWYRSPPYYVGENGPGDWLLRLAFRISPACRLVHETLDQRQVGAIPLDRITRPLVDRPTFTPEERARLLADFRGRVEAIARYCESMGTVPIFIVPGSNDRDYEPSRSALPARFGSAARESFAREFLSVRELEQSDPATAMDRYRALLDEAPEFAETHYRLARLLEAAGSWTLAQEHYIKARECDVMPMRCPEEFRQVYRDLATQHAGVVMVESARVLEPLSPHRILGDLLYHDAQHPTFRGYMAIAQEVLDRLCLRRAFGWPSSAPAPRLDPDECARHFELDKVKWSKVCERTAWFYEVTAYIRYDPTERLRRSEACKEAARQIASGKAADQVGITGLGVHPALLH